MVRKSTWTQKYNIINKAINLYTIGIFQKMSLKVP